MNIRCLVSLLVAGVLPAQQAGSLRIQVVEGDGAVHNIRRKAVSPTVVEVRDERGHPAPDVRVRFTLPAIGPGGRFADGERTYTTFTDQQGKAAMLDFSPNDFEGRFSLMVHASLGAREASAVISQTNSRFARALPALSAAPEPRRGSGAKVLLIVGVGAIAAVAGLVASKGGGGGTSAAGTVAPPVSIGIGSISVGGPR